MTELKQEKTFTRGKSFTGKGSVKMDALVNEAEKTAEVGSIAIVSTTIGRPTPTSSLALA